MPMNTHDFTVLHNRLYGRVFSFVRLRISDKEEVKDIVQDVFLKAFKSWEVLPDESTARNFLFVIARQKMIDVWRSGRKKYQTDLVSTNNDKDSDFSPDFDSFESDQPLPEDIFIQGEKQKQISEFLNLLKKEERELLVLRFLEELEYVELARIYKTTEDNIRQKVSRALQNLRKVANKKEK